MADKKEMTTLNTSVGADVGQSSKVFDEHIITDDTAKFNDEFYFSAGFNGDASAARRAVEQYRQILLQHGFRQAGQYPSAGQLFKRVDGVVYNVDTEHCFEGDPDRASIGFCPREPHGGFDYVKPEPKKNRDIDLKDIKKLFRF